MTVTAETAEAEKTGAPERLHTRIWSEEAEPGDPFTAAACTCAGYDVYGDLLGQATWVEYLHLLCKGERPRSEAARALEILAVALGNPGPRDPSVHAAMSAAAGGSTAASALMAALAVGAGASGGAREVLQAMEEWEHCGTDLAPWRERLTRSPGAAAREVWPEAGHPPGFDPHALRCAGPVRRTLALLAEVLPGGCAGWLAAEREALEALAGRPVSMMGVAAAALRDLGISPREGEMLVLLLRLPGAAAHALEQGERGHRSFPFFSVELLDDPAGRGAP